MGRRWYLNWWAVWVMFGLLAPHTSEAHKHKKHYQLLIFEAQGAKLFHPANMYQFPALGDFRSVCVHSKSRFKKPPKVRGPEQLAVLDRTGFADHARAASPDMAVLIATNVGAKTKWPPHVGKIKRKVITEQPLSDRTPHDKPCGLSLPGHPWVPGINDESALSAPVVSAGTPNIACAAHILDVLRTRIQPMPDRIHVRIPGTGKGSSYAAYLRYVLPWLDRTNFEVEVVSDAGTSVMVRVLPGESHGDDLATQMRRNASSPAACVAMPGVNSAGKTALATITKQPLWRYSWLHVEGKPGAGYARKLIEGALRSVSEP